MIMAMEVCTGSSAYTGCVHWMRNCMVDQLAHTEPYIANSFADAGERCAEDLPAWATRGM
jgi:hypothetical protein